MSCVVTLKDVKQDIKGILVDNHSTSKPLNDSVFFAYNSKNRDNLFTEVSNTKRNIDARYQTNKFGEVVTLTTTEFGIDARIHPSQEIATAMTKQNEMDDYIKELGDDFFMQDEALKFQEEGPEFDSRRTVNSKRPLTDNYVEYLRFKEAQLSILKEEKKEIDRLSSSPKADLITLGQKSREVRGKILATEGQIEDLRKNEVNLMFHSIITDLDNLDLAIDNIENAKSGEIQNKIKFYFNFITGTDYDSHTENTDIERLENFNHPDYIKILAKLNSIETKYNDNIEVYARKIIDENILYQENIKNNPAVSDEEIEGLFTATQDITWAEAKYLGINNANINDTIVPQIYYAEWRKAHAEEHSYTEGLIQRLHTFLAKKALKNFDFIFEKDKDGNPTGYITDVFTPNWFKNLKGFSQNTNAFWKDKNLKNYNEVTSWLADNADVIDMRKLKFFRGIYMQQYGAKFTFSDMEMDSYEADLRRKLGPKYDETIEKLNKRLQSFEHFRQEQLSTNNLFKHKNIAERDLWEFTSSFYDPQNRTKKINYTAGGTNTEETYFMDFSELSFLPKETTKLRTDTGVEEVETGHYNKTFKEISNDPNKLEYWTLMKEMSEYINSSYKTDFFGRMSYAKIQKDFSQKLVEAWQDKSIKKTLLLFPEVFKSWKSLFYEKGRFNEKEGVVSNYSDATNAEASQLAKIYISQGMSKEDANRKAKTTILSKYSTDINRDMEATLRLATINKARTKVSPTANVLLSYYSNIKSKEGKRVRGIERFSDHIERVVFNKNKKYRGTQELLGKSLSRQKDGSRKGFLLSDTEKEIFKELQKSLKEGFNETANFDFELRGITYISQDGKFYLTLGKGEPVEDIDQAEFEEAFKNNILRKISELGLDRNMAGIIQGVSKTVINQSLLLNFRSGIFNRIEGKHSGLIMDKTSYYSSQGNFAIAQNFLAMSNFARLSPDFVPDIFKRKIHELRKLEVIAEMFNTLQDRKNVLEKSVEDSSFDISKLNLFQFAVENPEFKNQMGISLGIMMDEVIIDNDGVEHRFFNGADFPAHDLIGGKLVLKDEFRNVDGNIENWDKFLGPKFFNLQLKIINAVNKSQGNYDPFDVTGITKEIYGSASMLFKNWFPEHMMNKYAKGEGTDLFTGKKKLEGYVRTAYRQSKGATAGYASGVASAVYGVFGLPGIIAPPVIGALGMLGSMVFYKYFHDISSEKAIRKDVAAILDFMEFYKSVLINSLNYPLDMLNISPGDKAKYRIKDTSFEKANLRGKNLTQQDINNLHALSQNLAIVLVNTQLKIAIALFLWDSVFGGDDDDEEVTWLKSLYYYTQNSLGQLIASITMYVDPVSLVDDMGRAAIITPIQDAIKLLSVIWNPKNRKGKKILSSAAGLTPLPRTLHKGIIKGQVPFMDELEWSQIPYFDNPMWQGLKPVRWTTKAVKALTPKGQDSNAKSEYYQSRKDVRERIVGKYVDEGWTKAQALDKAKADMLRDYPSKEPYENYSDILYRFNESKKAFE